MQQRKLAGVSGRPAGTDGSDFSYRMVVESRYTKVAKGKSQLYRLITAQGFIQSLGLLSLLLSATEESIYTPALAAMVVSIISAAIGISGLKHSKVNLLNFFMFASSTAQLLSMASLRRHNLLIEIVQDPSQWETNKFLLLEITGVVLGVLIQILAVSKTLSLVHNMSPPKRAY